MFKHQRTEEIIFEVEVKVRKTRKALTLKMEHIKY